MSKWYEKDFDRDTAIEFLEQIAEDTEDMLNRRMRRVPKMRHSRFNLTREFIPRGAVVHHSGTINDVDAFRAVERGLYGSHFLISRDISHRKNELTKHLPVPIYLMMDIEHAAPHSRYMSDITWGIDISNVGLLRAVPGTDPDKKVHHIYPEDLEITKKRFSETFIRNQGISPNQGRTVYTRYDGWTVPLLDGRRHLNKNGFYYEAVYAEQVTSLVVLLRALNKIFPLDWSLINPAWCVGNRAAEPIFNHLNWEYIRERVYNFDGYIEPRQFVTSNEKSLAIRSINSEKLYAPEGRRAEEMEITDIATDNSWRADIDVENLKKFESWDIDWTRGREFNSETSREVAISGLKRRVIGHVRRNELPYDRDIESVDNVTKMLYFAKHRKWPTNEIDFMNMLWHETKDPNRS